MSTHAEIAADELLGRLSHTQADQARSVLDARRAREPSAEILDDAQPAAPYVNPGDDTPNGSWSE